MARSKIAGAGVSVRHLEGSYQVVFWYRLERGRMHSETYDALTWEEALDVVQSELDGHRPGWEIGTGWRQPGLDDRLDRPWG